MYYTVNFDKEQLYTISNSNDNFKKYKNKLKYSNDFVEKINLCKNNLGLNNYGWIYRYIFLNKPLIDIAKKFLLDAYYNKENVCYELFCAYYKFKNNISISWKLARYLKYSLGILGTGWYYDNENKFRIIFFTIKDIIKELDGEEFFIWIDKMCICM